MLALATAVFWAIGNVLIKKSVGNLPKSLVYFSNAVFFLLLWLIYWLFKGGFQVHWLAIALSILPPLGFVYVLLSFSKADAGLVVAIGSIHPIITAILAVSFLGESLTGGQIGLIGLVAAGALIMSLPDKLVKNQSRQWLWWGLGYGLLAGLNNFTSKLGINQTDPMSFSLMIAGWQMAIAIIFLLREKQTNNLKVLVEKEGRWGLVGTGVYNLGSVAFFLALGAGPASLVMPVVNLFVPIILILAWWWLKEKMTLKQKIGAGIIVGSVMGLSVI